MIDINKIGKENLIKIIKESFNYAEVLKKINNSDRNGYDYRILKKFIEENNIDISHFKVIKRTSNEEIFCKNSKVSQHKLRNHYKKGNYSEYKCALCDLDEWNGMPIVLNLDHIDGNNHNNEISNLRWLCPNCDSQLPTFCNNKKEEEKVKHICKKCGKELSGKRKTGLCIECRYDSKDETISKAKKEKKYSKKLKECPTCGKLIRVSSRMCVECHYKNKKENSSMGEVSREELKDLIRTTSFLKIGEMYGITDNAVRKYCIKYNLPSKTSEVKKYTDEEWEKI